MTSDHTATPEPPELFPLATEENQLFGVAGDVLFGWRPARRSHDAGFIVSKYRWSGGRVVVLQWPLSQDGWREAWRYMLSEHPSLANAVAGVCVKTARSRAELVRRGEFRSELESEGILQTLAGCVLLGGYGFDAGLVPGANVDLYFTAQGLWVSRSGGFRPHLRRSYESAAALEFEGGAVRTGGGYVGGGFGALGAAEGMAIASLLNSLTTKTSVHTTIRFEADDAEVFFFTNQAVPRVLEMRFAEIRAKIKRAIRETTPPEPRAAGSDIGGQLSRLGEMLDKGQLTEEEFALAKARLLAG